MISQLNFSSSTMRMVPLLRFLFLSSLGNTWESTYNLGFSSIEGEGYSPFSLKNWLSWKVITSSSDSILMYGMLGSHTFILLELIFFTLKPDCYLFSIYWLITSFVFASPIYPYAFILRSFELKDTKSGTAIASPKFRLPRFKFSCYFSLST